MSRARTAAGVCAALLLLLLVAPAAQAATPCRVSVKRTYEMRTERGKPTVTRTAVVLCDRGRRRTFERGTYRGLGRLSHGTRILRVARRGRTLAIGRVVKRRGAKAATSEVRLIDLRTRKVRFRERARGQEAEVVLGARGELAWQMAGRLRVRRASGKVETLRAEGVREVRIEDGRTLRLGDGPFEYVELRPWPGGTCPRRSAFRPVLASPEVAVTSASYSHGGDSGSAIRACLKATGEDPVIGGGFGYDSGISDGAEVAAVAGARVVLASQGQDRAGCLRLTVQVHDARERRVVREGGRFDASCTVAPNRKTRLVVTPSGGTAWIARGPDPGVGGMPGPPGTWTFVWALRGDGKITELDRTEGAITGLRADGETVLWTRDGVERSAAL